MRKKSSIGKGRSPKTNKNKKGVGNQDGLKD